MKIENIKEDQELMEEMYVDQAINQRRQLSYFYTPEGIRRMDTLLSNRIRAFGRRESFTQLDWRGGVEWVWEDTAKILRHDIRTNPHLHPKIKENLLFNLRRYEKENQTTSAE